MIASPTRRKLLGALCASGVLGAIPHRATAAAPIRIGLSAEFGMQGSRSAQAIERGILLAMDDINAQGGVLGRKLALETRDDRGVPARGVDNFAELAANPEVVAIFSGRYSPVTLEQAPLANRLGVPLLAPWAAADGIVKHPPPNYVFRVSANDTWAMQTLLGHARRKKYGKLALLLPNTAWGRSSEAAVTAELAHDPSLRFAAQWYNWGDSDFLPQLQQARTEGARALVLVANESEGIHVVRQMASLPPQQRLPILSHWGITGGEFAADAGSDLLAVDLVVVQTFSFTGNNSAIARTISAAYAARFGQPIASLRGQVGFAHAHDLTHLLALAIRKAGTTDRAAVRNAMERLDSYSGLVRIYQRPFSATNHEGLERKQLFIARFAADGSLKTIPN